MLFYRSLYEGVSWTEWLGVMWHGLPLDLSLAGYLTVVPGLLFICSAWTVSNLLRRIWYGYFAFVSVLLSVIFTVDLGLYEYWGFRLDTTPLFYFFSSPKDAVASVSIWVVIGGIIAMVAYAAALYGIFHGVLLRKRVFERMKIPYRRLRVSGVLLLLTGLLFIPIRGGFTVSTMNTGKVYFSTDQRLNHAAINPAFSLMESLSKQKDFGSQYRFMEADAASLLDGSRVLATETGEVQFTDYGLSGICIMQLSGLLAPGRSPKAPAVELDLFPALDEAELTALFRSHAAQTAGDSPAGFWLGLLNRKLGCAVWSAAGLRDGNAPAVLTAGQWQKLARTAKHWRFEGLTPCGWKQAQVTGGGLSLREVDAHFQFQGCPGLYFVGETLDCAGSCGGFNLHWAFGSGIAAGRDAARRVQRQRKK